MNLQRLMQCISFCVRRFLEVLLRPDGPRTVTCLYPVRPEITTFLVVVFRCPLLMVVYRWMELYANISIVS